MTVPGRLVSDSKLEALQMLVQILTKPSSNMISQRILEYLLHGLSMFSFTDIYANPQWTGAFHDSLFMNKRPS